jgi:hypothetical protein
MDNRQFTGAGASFSSMLQAQSLFPNSGLLAYAGSATAPVNSEKERIASRLQGFDHRDNDVWKAISRKFGTNLKQEELLSIANVLAERAGVHLDRDAKRRKAVLVKWFNENWAAVSPYLDYIVLQSAPTS